MKFDAFETVEFYWIITMSVFLYLFRASHIVLVKVLKFHASG